MVHAEAGGSFYSICKVSRLSKEARLMDSPSAHHRCNTIGDGGVSLDL